MDASFITARNTTTRAQILRLVRIAGPFVLSMIAAWGTVQYARGREAQRLDIVDKLLEENRKALDNTLTREEFRNWTAEQRERFEDLREYLRDLKRSR